jgi:WhiB family redox-sensing transcriptional regulator
MNWRHRAACRDEAPEQFFPAAERGPVRDAEIAQAKAVCQRCPVVTECLTHALAREDFGVWGGLDEHERRALKRQTAGAA